MELTIKWNISAVRKMAYEEFHSLCRTQYNAYYKKIDDAQIIKEFEHITGKKVKTKKIKENGTSM